MARKQIILTAIALVAGLAVEALALYWIDAIPVSDFWHWLKTMVTIFAVGSGAGALAYWAFDCDNKEE